MVTPPAARSTEVIQTLGKGGCSSVPRVKNPMRKGALALFTILLAFYFSPLPFRPLISPDEARYAEIPREMLASGDIIVPRFDGLRYFEKPVLGYWITAASMKLFGEGAFAARLPSTLAAAFSALLLFYLVRRFRGAHDAGALTLLVFLTCFEVYGLGTFSTLDGMLSFFVTGSMVSFFFAYRENRPRTAMAFFSLSGVFAGLAFLTKGFIAFAIPVTVIIPFLIWEGRLRDWIRLCWRPIAAAILVALPWAVMIHLRERDYWNYFFWEEHVRRFVSYKALHLLGLGFFIPVLLVGSVPWVFLFPAALSGLRKVGVADSLIRFAWCWFLAPFLFFSVSRGKLLTYILPCYGPLSILVVAGLLSYLGSGRQKAFVRWATLFALTIGVCLIIIVMVQLGEVGGISPYGRTGETWKWLLGGFAGALCCLLVFRAVREADPYKRLWFYGLAPMSSFLAIHFILPSWFIDTKAPGVFLERHRNLVSSDCIVVAESPLVGIACWVYRRSDLFVLFNAGELDYGARYDDAGERVLRNPEELTAFIGKHAPTRRIILITNPDRWRANRHLFPEFRVIDSDGSTLIAELDVRDTLWPGPTIEENQSHADRSARRR